MRSNKIIYFMAICVIACGFVSCGNTYAKDAKLTTELDSINYAWGVANGAQIKEYYLSQDSTGDNMKALIKGVKEAVKKDDPTLRYYALGLNIGSSILEQGKGGMMGDSTLKVDADLMLGALIGAIKGEEVKISAEDADVYLRGIMEKIQSRRAEESFAENKKAGEDFLAENANRPGVVVTESGLQYEVLVAGKGEKPAATDKVSVHYQGTLIDGTVFDSSYERGKPASFEVNRVIKGWTEALQLMSVGSKWKIYIPYALAYGSQDAGQIKPFSALIFEVELLGIEK